MVPVLMLLGAVVAGSFALYWFFAADHTQANLKQDDQAEPPADE